MIIIDLKPVVQHEKCSVYWRSIGIDWGNFCDYSHTEDLVRIEHHSGERSWHDISVFFRGYPIRTGRYIGIGKGENIKTYMVKSLEPRKIRNNSFLYAELLPAGGERPFDFDKDHPLERLDHELNMNIEDDLPF